jgi:8-oxo-dGTP pyrophosphatase MutT (NUDIX family)
METVVICNNCGLKGHMYRECRKPVMSYGHLIYSLQERDPPKILMILRKDSLCYTEFLRGKYDIHNLSYIQTLIDKCSHNEKQRLISMSYDELWSDLWRLETVDMMNMKFKGDYLKGKGKFERLRMGYINRDIHITLKYFTDRSTTQYETSEWEFPKGRRNYHESNRECAIREFGEETGYTTDDYTLIQNIKPFEEEYVGENKVRYKHVYYIGYLTNFEKSLHIDSENEFQISEIQDIQWFTKEQALGKIRDYHHTRYHVINQVFDFLAGFDTHYNII